VKLGLITDIHEHVEFLRVALDALARMSVDQIVVLGDVFETGERMDETCRLLADAKAIGVWGNHDVGLCVDPDEEFCIRYSSAVIDYMRSLRPKLDVNGLHFAHVEPWLNPELISDLWYYEGPPDTPEKLSRIFNAVSHRIMFAGHFHQWCVATPARIEAWAGDHPLRLDKGRYFVVIAALCGGHYATFDTETSELVPFKIG
jgi:hypothetical protein